jgi:hypothetical protein
MAGLFSSAHLVVVDDQKRPSSFYDLRNQEFQHRSIFNPAFALCRNVNKPQLAA